MLLVAGACSPAAPPLRHETALHSTGGTNPTTAVGPGGQVFVTWVGQDDSTAANVYLARSDDGSSFGPSVRVNTVDGDAAPHLQAPAQLATGPDGAVYVAWQSTRPVAGLMFGAADVRLARSTDGGRTFGPAVSVNDDAGRIQARHTFHDLAIAHDGTVYVSWIDARYRDSARVEAAKRNPPRHSHGRGPGAPTPSAMSKRPGEPTVDIRVARSTDSGRSFTPGVVVDTNACTCCRTAMALAADGSLYVAWRKLHAGDVNDIVVSRSADGGRTWGAPVKVHDDGWVFPGCPHGGPDLLVDAENVLHAVWYTGAEGRQGLYYGFSRDQGRTFSAPVPLVTDGSPVAQARLATAGTDAVWIAWEDRRTEQLTIGLAWASNTGRFRRVDTQALPGTSPSMESLGGRMAVAWLDNETVRVRAGG